MKKLILLIQVTLFFLTFTKAYSQSGWNLVANFSDTDLNKAIFIDENIGFCVGIWDDNRWIIYKTTNGGNNWSQTSQYPPTMGSVLNSICFINNNTGFAVGSSGGSLLIKTTNQGQSWVRQNLNISNGLSDISFRNEYIGYIVGTGDLVLKTTNGGNNWFQLNTGTTNVHITEIKTPRDDANYVFAIGYPSLFLKSTNGGTNWNITSFPPGLKIKRISLFTNPNTGYVSGGIYDQYAYKLMLYKTTNSGNNWIDLSGNIPYQHSYSNGYVNFVNENTGWYGAKQIIKTTDGGLNWKYQDWYYLPQLLFYDIYFLNQNFGIVINSYQTIYNSFIGITTTGGDGVPWAPAYLICYRQYEVNRLAWHDGSDTELGFKIQRKNAADTIWYTIDSVGTNILGYNDSNSVTDVRYRVYAFNEYGNSGYSNEVAPIVLGIQNKEIVVGYSLFQNYPNPFNPTTNIKFDIQKTSATKLIIYDALGREIETLVNEELKAGSYQVDWDGSGYPSGMYFYRLVAGDFVNVKRMVLIK